jgi:hypothetical protein
MSYAAIENTVTNIESAVLYRYIQLMDANHKSFDVEYSSSSREILPYVYMMLLKSRKGNLDEDE